MMRRKPLRNGSRKYARIRFLVRVWKTSIALAFDYGTSHFGSMFWYREKDKLAKKLKTLSDRCNFRFRLKADVDFIHQLNMLDFEEILKNGNSDALKLLQMQEPVLPAVILKFLENAPHQNPETSK